ncbi:MAG: hypothetical protein RLN86_05785 [Cyclobacteriaceae bacterium]
MKFSSIKEYFYKLYNICYLITLFPLGIFIYLYLQMQVGKLNSLVQEAGQILIFQIGLATISLAVLTTVHLVMKRRIKKIRTVPSLGDRLEYYYYYSIQRMMGIAVASSFMALGLWLTNSDLFSILYLVILIWLSLQWPSPKMACKDLALRGDEREMVLYKRDTLG